MEENGDHDQVGKTASYQIQIQIHIRFRFISDSDLDSLFTKFYKESVSKAV